jgi:hypothetical protein
MQEAIRIAQVAAPSRSCSSGLAKWSRARNVAITQRTIARERQRLRQRALVSSSHILDRPCVDEWRLDHPVGCTVK